MSYCYMSRIGHGSCIILHCLNESLIFDTSVMRWEYTNENQLPKAYSYPSINFLDGYLTVGSIYSEPVTQMFKSDLKMTVLNESMPGVTAIHGHAITKIEETNLVVTGGYDRSALKLVSFSC